MPPGPALRVGDMVICPIMDGPKPHMVSPMPITPAGGIPTVLIGGMPAAVAGRPGAIPCASAPNGIAVGSLTVLIGGAPAARLADVTMHGPPAVPGPGCPTVIIGG